MINRLRDMFSESGIFKKVAIIGGAAIAIIVLVGIFLTSNIFKSDMAKIALAFNNTFKDQSKLVEDLKIDEMNKWIKDEKYTMNFFIEDEYECVDLSIGVNPSEIRLFGELEGESTPETDFVFSYTDQKLQAQLPAISDTIFVYDYTKIPEGYALDLVGEENFKQINEILSMYWNEGNSNIETKMSNAIMDIIKEMEIEKLDSKEYMVDNRNRRCQGYSLIFTDTEVLDILDATTSILKEELDDDTYNLYADSFDEFRETMKEFPETEVKIYIYKNKLACINTVIEDNNTELEWLFKGGNFRTQNMEITVKNEYDSSSFKVEGKKDGNKEAYEFYIDDEELFVLKYDGDSDNFFIEVEDEILRGHISSERNSVAVSFDLEETELNISFSKGTNFEPLSGKEFNIGDASEDDFEEVFENNEELYNTIEEFLLYSLYKDKI